LILDNTSYQIPTNENLFNEVIFDKTQICIANTGRLGMLHFSSWLNKTNSNITTYSINIDGTVYEHFNPKFYTNLTNTNQDKKNITISLVNPGWLKFDNNRLIFYDWLGNIYPKQTTVKSNEWRGYNNWFKYSDEQIKSLKELLSKICDIYNIKHNLITTKGYYENVESWEGITFITNYNKYESSINPYFWENF